MLFCVYVFIYYCVLGYCAGGGWVSVKGVQYFLWKYINYVAQRHKPLAGFSATGPKQCISPKIIRILTFTDYTEKHYGKIKHSTNVVHNLPASLIFNRCESDWFIVFSVILNNISENYTNG